MKKFLSTSIAIVIMVLSLCGTAFADNETIDIMYGDINVYINGILTEFQDEYGADIEPFIYNGKVYLPLNCIAEAMNMSYEWEGSSMSAYMGASKGETQYLQDVCPPYQSNDVHFYSINEGTSFSMAGTSYTNGIVVEPGQNDSGYALYNLNGQYESLSFVVGHVDDKDMCDSTLQIYLDGKLAQEISVPCEGLPQQITIPLDYALSMKLCVLGNGWWNCGLGEMTIA